MSRLAGPCSRGAELSRSLSRNSGCSGPLCGGRSVNIAADPPSWFGAMGILRPRGFRNNRISSVPLRGMLSLNFMATEEELKAEIARLRAENQALQRPARGQMYLKVSEKGALSVYGLGRFPVTLYREQWEKPLGMADEIRAFIQENDGALKRKE
jgi:hypothetical protein